MSLPVVAREPPLTLPGLADETAYRLQADILGRCRPLGAPPRFS